MLGFLCLAALLAACGPAQEKRPLLQEPLPYAQDALEPYISAKTMSYHYGKHHATYVANANRLMKGTNFEGKPSEKIIELTAGNEKHAAIFNNVAQSWNHAYFWKCIKPAGGGMPNEMLLEKFQESLGGFDAFKEKFVAAAKSQFGSGWAWLVLDGKTLKIVTTANADTPLAHGLRPVFAVDVWEHAYYLDYQDQRGGFVQAVLDHLADWDFVAQQLGKEMGSIPD
jgi:Fe-Mn family superoxide dismutase